MRIISQNGTIDMPYDMCCVWRQEEVIYCRAIGSDDNVMMATYSSSEKAETVEKLLRRNALHFLEFQFAENAEKDAEIFFYQFPEEDELIKKILPKRSEIYL